MRPVSLMLSLALLAWAGPARGYDQNSAVLARQSQGEFWYPALVLSEEGDEITVQYLAGASQETLSKEMVAPLKFLASGPVECDTNADGTFEPGKLTAKSKGDKMVVKFAKGGEKAVDFLNKCRLPLNHGAEAEGLPVAEDAKKQPTCKKTGAPATSTSEKQKENGKYHPLFSCPGKDDLVLCPDGQRGLIRNKGKAKLFLCREIQVDPSCKDNNCGEKAAAQQDCAELPYKTNVPLCSAGNAANKSRVDDQGRTLWYCTNKAHTPRCPNNGCLAQEGGVLDEANPDRKVFFCEGVSAPEEAKKEETSDAASANGKFKKLVGSFDCPEACEQLGSSKCNGQPGDFYMANGGQSTSGDQFCSQEKGSVGAEGNNYWVYAKPKWYVWLCRSDANPAYNPECQ